MCSGHRVTLYLCCFVQISIRLCTLQKHFYKIYKFPKLILVFSTFSQAQQSRNELIAPTRLPCLHFSRLYWTDYMSARLVREKILVNKWTQDVLLILFCSSAWNGAALRWMFKFAIQLVLSFNLCHLHGTARYSFINVLYISVWWLMSINCIISKMSFSSLGSVTSWNTAAQQSNKSLWKKHKLH